MISLKHAFISQQTVQGLKKAQAFMENTPQRVGELANVLKLELEAEQWPINLDDFDYENDPQTLENAIIECEEEYIKSQSEQFLDYQHGIEIY